MQWKDRARQKDTRTLLFIGDFYRLMPTARRDADLSPILYMKGYENSSEKVFSYTKNTVQGYLKEMNT